MFAHIILQCLKKLQAVTEGEMHCHGDIYIGPTLSLKLLFEFKRLGF